MNSYAVMQPYFLPYLGYWQLMNAVDVFVLYDDVQFVKGGWMHRNQLLTEGGAKWMTFPLQKAEFQTLIKDMKVNDSGLDKFWMQTRGKLKSSLSRSPFLSEALFWIDELQSLSYDKDFYLVLRDQIEWVHSRLCLRSELRSSTDLDSDSDQPRVARLVDIGHELGSKSYVNSPGGRSLYASADFEGTGISLSFFQPQLDKVLLEIEGERSCLSILDNIARFGEESVRELVKFGKIQKA